MNAGFKVESSSLRTTLQQSVAGAGDLRSASVKRSETAPQRAGFTLIEILIVIGVILVLISLLLPAIQAARETGRRHSCANNLSQLLIATENYTAVHGVLPPGTIEAKGPIQNRPVGYHMSWIAQLLPYFEQNNVFEQIDFSVGAYHARNASMRRMTLGLLNCPSSQWTASFGGSYAGCHHDLESPIDADNHGAFFLNSALEWNDLRDGRAQTILLGEKFGLGFDFGWISGTRSTLRNTGTPINATSQSGGPLSTAVAVSLDPADAASADVPQPAQTLADAARPVWRFRPEDNIDSEYQPAPRPGGPAPALVVGGFESRHPHGAQFGFGDGSVRLVSEDIDNLTYQRLGHRADGNLVDERF